MATGSAVVYWHEAKGLNGAPLPWRRVSVIAVADLQPLVGNSNAPITEKMPCKGLHENQAFPCIVLVVSEGEDVNELRRNFLTVEQEKRLAATGRRWAAELEAQKAAMDARPLLADAVPSGSNTQAASVVLEELEQSVPRKRAPEVTRLMAQGVPYGVRRGRRPFLPSALRPRSFSPEIDAPSERASGGISAAVSRPRGRPAMYPVRPDRKVKLGQVYTEGGVKKKHGGKLPSLFSPHVPVPPVSTWKIVKNVDVAELQKELDGFPTWQTVFRQALYKFFSLAELHSPDATAYMIDQTRLQVVVGITREFCVKKNVPLPSSTSMSNVFCCAKQQA